MVVIHDHQTPIWLSHTYMIIMYTDTFNNHHTMHDTRDTFALQLRWRCQYTNLWNSMWIYGLWSISISLYESLYESLCMNLYMNLYKNVYMNLWEHLFFIHESLYMNLCIWISAYESLCESLYESLAASLFHIRNSRLLDTWSSCYFKWVSNLWGSWLPDM